ncbi:hypothetical protein EYF80_063249 [Liparis tanakae]|uniref:Uncharacterized protein n=1 Tax=Liparis tanakae TaxID=230148 RepID=A0A4Z2ED03_9TELE|nr:hypothetical protein EYF80_063249 [Liparis tanakae]
MTSSLVAPPPSLCGILRPTDGQEQRPIRGVLSPGGVHRKLRRIGLLGFVNQHGSWRRSGDEEEDLLSSSSSSSSGLLLPCCVSSSVNSGELAARWKR